MDNKPKQSRYMWSTMGSMVIAFVLYPMSTTLINEVSELEFLSLALLIIASYLAWRAFTLNKTYNFIRQLIQMPATAIITLITMCNAWVIYVERWWYHF